MLRKKPVILGVILVVGMLFFSSLVYGACCYSTDDCDYTDRYSEAECLNQGKTWVGDVFDCYDVEYCHPICCCFAETADTPKITLPILCSEPEDKQITYDDIGAPNIRSIWDYESQCVEKCGEEIPPELLQRFNITGTVTNATDGNALEDVTVLCPTEHGPIFDITEEDGKYKLINIDKGIHRIFLKKRGCVENITEYFNLDQNLEMDLTMDCSMVGCELDEIEMVSIEHPTGERSIELEWDFEDNCNNLIGFIVTRCIKDDDLSCREIPTGVNIFLTDTYDIQENTKYCYNVTAVTENQNIMSDEMCVETGNLTCMQPRPPSFCYLNNVYECTIIDDVNNRLKLRDDCVTDMCIADARGRAVCSESSECDNCNGIYGMFALLDPYTDIPTGSAKCSQRTYTHCYRDRTNTSVNRFYSCSEALSCYHYKSEGTCGDDPCNRGVGGCVWEDLNEELGLGVCRPAEEEEADCMMCNDLYGDECTESVCQNFGNCYYNQLKKGTSVYEVCLGKDSMACRYYDTEADCTNTVNADVNVTWTGDERTAGDHAFIEGSNDYFGFGTCRWVSRPGIDYTNGICIKDADSYSMRIDGYYDDDCMEQGMFGLNCIGDNEPPTTTLMLRDSGSYKLSEFHGLRFAVTDNRFGTSDIKTYFCVTDYGGSCYPDQDINEIDIRNTRQYQIYYYSVDLARNLEPIKTTVLTIEDEEYPRITNYWIDGIERDDLVPNPIPNISVEFSEPVTIDRVQLKNLDTEEFIGITYIPTSASTIKDFKPTTFLESGSYSLQINYLGTSSNEHSSNTIDFDVQISFMDIIILEPSLGISDHKPFDLRVRTEKAATCRYDQSPSTIVKAYSFHDTGETIHVVNDMGTTDVRPILNDDSGSADNYAKDIYLSCVEPSKTTSLAHFKVGYDTSIPSLTITAEPAKVVDYLVPETTITVSSNDRIVCYIDGQKFFEFDENNIEDYTYNPSVTIDYTSVARENYPQNLEPHEFEYNITCINPAGLSNTRENFKVVIDFDEVFDIAMLSPGTYTNEDPVNFSVETSLTTIDGCTYGETTPDQPMNALDTKNYYVLIEDLEEGEHTFVVECRTNFGARDAEFTFTVDRTPPGEVNITADEESCSLRRLKATFKAEDNEGGSGISGFYYTLKQGRDIIKERFVSRRMTAVARYEEGETYTVEVYAIDKAGNEGPIEDFDFKITDPESVSCDFTRPKGHVRATKLDGQTLLNVTCYDEESGCTEKFGYGLAPEDEDCNITNEQSYGTEVVIRQDSEFCFEVYDKNGNEYRNQKFFTVDSYPDHCTNRVKDEDETDVDCGGSCPPCDEPGEDCVTDDDCTEARCVNGKCQPPSCDDGLHNGEDETDVDCGGNCPKCAFGMKCNVDWDCETGYCNWYSGMGTCDNSLCSDGITNGDESGTDCGGSCPKCEDGESCYEDTNCRGGSCVGGICQGEDEQPTTICVDDYDCLEDEFCNEYGECESYGIREEDEGRGLMPTLLLILGIVLLGGGLGYLVYTKYYRGGFPPSEEPHEEFDFGGAIAQETGPVEQEPIIKKESPKIKYMREKAAKQRDALRMKARKSLFSHFEKEKPKPAAKPAAEKPAVKPTQAVKKTVQKPVAQKQLTQEKPAIKPTQKKPSPIQQKEPAQPKPVQKKPVAAQQKPKPVAKPAVKKPVQKPVVKKEPAKPAPKKESEKKNTESKDSESLTKSKKPSRDPFEELEELIEESKEK